MDYFVGVRYSAHIFQLFEGLLKLLQFTRRILLVMGDILKAERFVGLRYGFVIEIQIDLLNVVLARPIVS